MARERRRARRGPEISLRALQPPATQVLCGVRPHPVPGYLFVGPAAVDGAHAGPTIVDEAGDPVWFAPLRRGRWLTNFAVRTYRGALVLIWWEGVVVTGYGQGEAVIAESSYREIARVTAATGATWTCTSSSSRIAARCGSPARRS